MKKNILTIIVAFVAVVFSFTGCKPEYTTYSGPNYIMFSDTLYEMAVVDNESYFDVPVVFAKKSRSSNISSSVFSSKVVSYTHGSSHDIIISKQFLSPNDRVLIIDDFLATGNALFGLIDIVEQSGATVVGCGIVIEKAYQNGGQTLRERGYRVESLAKIKSMSENKIEFC